MNFITFYSFAQTQHEFYTHKFNTYFSKDPKLADLVSIDEHGISIFSDDASVPDIFLNWQQVNTLAPVIDNISEGELKKLIIDEKDSLGYYMLKDSISKKSKPTSFKGLKVAIDPGHIGGSFSMGETESRCMNLSIDSDKQIQLVEGNLTFYTALLLKRKLDSLGATVMFSRSDTGLSSFGITFFQWKKKVQNKTYLDSLIRNNLISAKGVHLLNSHLSDKALFSDVFGSVDMAMRAKKINAFKPDVTVIIHYNVDEINTGWKFTSDKDFVMAFVPGCVTAADLKNLSGRLNFLRLLLSNDIENSVKFSSAVVNKISSTLSVPLAAQSNAIYLEHACLSTPAKGVYARDLALTRMIKGPLVYGEALYQDNESECVLLTAKDDTISGFDVSKRIELVAEAYFEGIKEYLEVK